MARKRKKELSMRKIREILRLALENKMKNREIARSCSISHVAVGNYLRKVEKAGLIIPQIEQMDDETLRGLLKNGNALDPADSRPEPDYLYIHKELSRKGVTLTLLWQEYKEIHPNGCQSTQFNEKYNKWRKKLDVSLRQTHKAGEKMFVDYAGHTVSVIDRKTGEVQDAQIFVATLGASNYTYVEATMDQSLPNWINSHVRAFEYFGGIPKVVVPDNLKSGVSKSCRYEPDINPTYHDMAIHYNTVVMPARARKPKDKAKVEVAVQIAERWILAVLRNRTFFSIARLNEAIFELLEKFNTKPFAKLPGSRLSQFEALERDALMSLPTSRYIFAQWKKGTVNIDYHVELCGHFYSVPYKLVRELVDVRYTNTTVEIFKNSKRVASHMINHQKGAHTTIKEHMPKKHQQYLDWSPSRIIRRAGKVGESTASIIEKIINEHEYPQQGYRSCLGILCLGKQYSDARLEAACHRAVKIGGCSYKSIKSILDKGLDKQELPESKAQPIPSHSNIRGTNYYKN